MLSPSRKAMEAGKRSIWSRRARWSEPPVPPSPRKTILDSRAWPRSVAAARSGRTKARTAPRRRRIKASAPRSHRHSRQLFIEMHGRGDALLEVAEVQALVLGVGVAGRVL